jgi:hypothetical protein
MLEPEEFPILPWGWTPGEESALEGIRECGFNLAGFVAPEHLDLVRAAGLKCFVFDESIHVADADAAAQEQEIQRRAQALVQRVGDHQAVFGYYLRDEPGARLYPALARWTAAFRRAAPGALAYINLFPNYASPQQMDVASYAVYLDSYIETVQPAFISYDHYALMDDGSLRHGYFQNLETIRAAARRHQLPFWNIVLSNAHFHHAEPTPAGLRFQLYTTLAYGGRGISYYNYFDLPIGNFRSAPVDQFGHRTPTWEMLRNVNLQAHRLGPVYLTLRSVNVFHHPEVPAGCSGVRTSRLTAKVRGRSLMVGEFEGPGGQPFVLVVNKSLQHSTTFQVEFKEPGQIHLLNAYTGRAEPWVGVNDWLAPGQGMLLCPEIPGAQARE